MNERVGGHALKLTYMVKKGVAPVPSALQTVRNYQNAVKAAGGEVLDDHPASGWHSTTLRLKKDGKEVLDGHPGQSRRVCAQHRRASGDAAGRDDGCRRMATGLGAKGSVALYGIYFDTGKADPKPESDPALKEIAALLAGNTGLKVFVVGHTDMVGDAATNMKLSQARAEAIVAALVSKHAVAPGG